MQVVVGCHSVAVVAVRAAAGVSILLGLIGLDGVEVAMDV